MMSSTSFHLSSGLDREKKMGFFQFFPQPKVLLTSIAWFGNCILSFSESTHHVLQTTIVPKRNCGQALSALWTSFFSFVCGNGQFKMAHCTPKKKDELGRHPNV
jgi:hypothetical protein